jgi:hypothetical protein
MNIMQMLDQMRDYVIHGKNLRDLLGDKYFSIPTLYRGDTIDRGRFPVADWRHKGESFANLMTSEGIHTKFNGSHATLDILSRPIEYLVCAHVGYPTPGKSEQQGAAVPEEVRISKHSPLISFSDEKKLAGNFQNRGQKADLVDCEYESATHFIFRLSGLEGFEYKPGMYLVPYKPSSVNAAPLSSERMARAQETYAQTGQTDALAQALGEAIAVQNIVSMNPALVMTVIDLPKFLEHGNFSGVDIALRDEALKRAKKWREWLVYPGLPGSVDGFSQRIVPTAHLTFEHFAKDDNS